MGAEVQHTVTVLMAIECEVEVSAVTCSEAMEKAERIPGVVKAIRASDSCTILPAYRNQARGL